MDMILNLNLLNNGYSIFKYLLSPNHKNQIIEPLSTIIRLCILYYKPTGTKIGIANNKLYFHDPNIFQSTIRTIHGDNKDDIFNLIFPIENACKLYLTKAPDEKMIWFFNMAKSGLVRLKTTYKYHDKIILRINDYIKLIDDYLSKPIENINNIESSIVINEIEIKNLIYNKLKDIWSPNKIAITYNILQEIDLAFSKLNSHDVNCLIKSLESILDPIDKRIKDILNCIS